jgi:hypothetical protein
MEKLMKSCTKCKEIKPLTEFYNHVKHGPRPECKACTKLRSANIWKDKKEELTLRNRNWLDNNKERRKKYTKVQNLKRKYGLTLEQYEAMLLAQRGKCPICNKELDACAQKDVDHCHNTGKIRDILCSNCNKGLGCFDDNPECMIAAAEYVKRHQGVI